MTIDLDADFYALTVIKTMAEQFSDYMEIEYIVKENNISIEMIINQQFQNDQGMIINTFMNNVFELSIQEKMNNEN